MLFDAKANGKPIVESAEDMLPRKALAIGWKSAISNNASSSKSEKSFSAGRGTRKWEHISRTRALTSVSDNPGFSSARGKESMLPQRQ